jgi:hypothetical protein
MSVALVPLVLTAASPATPLVLSDGTSIEHWSAGVALVPDAGAGRPAVRYTVPEGGPRGPFFDFSHLTTPLTGDLQLIFWYRFSGRGSSSLFVKLIDPQYSQGWQATWEIASRAEAKGEWVLATVDLASEWMKWGDRPVTGGRSLNFRTEGSKGCALTLDLADIRFSPKLFTASLKETQIRDGAGTAEFELTNLTTTDLVLLTASGDQHAEVSLPGGATRRVGVAVAADPAAWQALPPLAALPVVVTVAAKGAPEAERRFLLNLARPLALPPHPRLLLSAAEIPVLKAKMERLDWARAAFAAEKKRADEWLAKAVELPPRGSQWWHWYACKKDGARLQTVSPTEHTCTVCGQVYSGWPYDDVVLDRLHGALADGLRTLGLIYQFTQDPRYAAKAKEILLAYAARYESYPLHNIHGKPAVGGARVGPQTLDESTWLIPMCQGADLIWETLTDAEREQAAKGLFRPAAEVILQHRMGIHNIQCWKNSAVGLVGLLLADPALVADAITSPHGFREQVAQGVSADGQWYEGAWGYHFYTVSALIPLLEAGERCGLGLYAFERDGRSCRGLFDAPLDLSMPNLVLPAFNDSGTVNVKSQARAYECALARYGKPRYAEAIGPDRRNLQALLVGVDVLPAPPAEAGGSRNVTAAGYAILAHGSGSQSTWLCLKYGPHGGGHGHDDKLNLLAYRKGTAFAIDPGTAPYGVPIQNEWFRATLAHNTLTVDEQNQKPATGTCLAFGAQPDTGLAAVLAEAGPVYADVVYRRAVALVDADLVLILDLVTAPADHTFDLAWHNTGTWAAAPVGTPVELPRKPGYMHLKDTVRVAGPLPVIQAAKDLPIGVAVTSPTEETWAGRGFNARDENRPVAIVRRTHGRTAVVGWAFALTGNVPVIRISGSPDDACLEVDTPSGPLRLLVRPGTPTPLAVEALARRLDVPAL